MSDREDILQGVRGALKTAFSLSDAQVIVQDADAIRPPLPYMTVKVTTSDTLSGVLVDWTVHGTTGALPTKASRGPRDAVVEVVAYGREATEWLEALPHHLDRDAEVHAVLSASGLSVLTSGALVDVAALLDTDTEARALRTIGVRYESTGPAFDAVEFVKGELDLTVSSHEGPGSVTIGTVLDPDAPFC